MLIFFGKQTSSTKRRKSSDQRVEIPNREKPIVEEL